MVPTVRTTGNGEWGSGWGQVRWRVIGKGMAVVGKCNGRAGVAETPNHKVKQ